MFIIYEYLKTKRNIQDNSSSERVGESSTQHELSKLCKPVTDAQKELKESIVSEMKPIREGIKNLPKAITFLQFPFITVYDDDGEVDRPTLLGDIAEQCLRKFASV